MIGLNTVRREHWLWLMSAALSLLNLFLNMLILGAWPLIGSGLHFKIAFPTSIPTVSDVIANPQIQLTASSFGSFVLLAVLWLFTIYMTGGYLAGGMRALRGEIVDMSIFWADCQYFFQRMLLAGLFLILLTVVLFTLLAVIHPIVALIALIAVLLYLFFWQMAIVYEDMDLLAGLKRSHAIMKLYLSEVIALVITIGLASGITSLVLNWFAKYYTGYLLAVFIWSFVGAVLFIAVLHSYIELVKKHKLNGELACQIL